MYIGNVYRKGLFVYASVMIKDWNENMGSNTIIILKEKRFFTRLVATAWILKMVSCDLHAKGKLEIING